MPSKIAFPVILCALVGAASGCTGADAAATGDIVAAATRPFAELYQKQSEVTLEQPDSAPIVRISGIDLGPGGRILLSDVSEGNVKLFGPDGTLLRIIGRKGGGPGEFTAPRYPRFGPGGRIFVADAQDPRIQIFDVSGNLLSGIRLPDVGIVQGFHPLENGNLLILASLEDRPSVLVELDTAGKQVREFLPINAVRPTGQGEYPLWNNIHAFSLDVRGDTAFVSNSLSDSLWSVHLPSGTERRVRMVIPGYVSPTPADPQPTDFPALMKWSNGFHTSSTITASGGVVALPFVRGVLNNGDPMLLVTRTVDGWSVSTDAPPVIGGGNGIVFGLLTPGEETIRLGRFTPVVNRP